MLHTDEINKALLTIYDVVQQVRKSDNPDEAAAVYLTLNMAKKEIGEMLDAVKDALIEQMGASVELRYENFVLERKTGAPRKTWQHETLGEVVARRLVDMSTDMDTGELTRSPIDIAVDILTFAAPSYWRVTELGKIGINADNYCEIGEPKQNIIIRRES